MRASLRNWKQRLINAVALAALATSAYAELHQGNLVINPSFGDQESNYSNWQVNNNWRTHHIHKNLVYDFCLPKSGTGYKGYATAVAETTDFNLIPSITQDPRHAAQRTFLTGIRFLPIDITLSGWNYDKVGDQLDATLYCEAEIKTKSGSYRAQSNGIAINRQSIVENKTVSTGTQTVSLKWWAEYGNYGGDPFTNGNSIHLSDIIQIDYKWIVYTRAENAFSSDHPGYTDEGIFYLQVDNAGLEYEVRSEYNPLSIAGLFSNNMVLQREVENPVWGKADPHAKVTVTIKDVEPLETIANERGDWSVTLPPMHAGDAVSMSAAIEDGTTVTLSNILFGDVWVCSGQSNMEWNLNQTDDCDLEIQNAGTWTALRLVEVHNRTASTPQTNLQTQWQISSPKTAGDFSAVAYYFGKQLHSELGIPIGLIDTNWGGTRIEPWIPHLLSNGHPGERHQAPTVLYNQMIHPFTQLPIKGVIWYQGESNLGDGPDYTNKLSTLVKEWRSAWQQGDFPFYFVQLAPFKYDWDSSGHKLPEFWEAQDEASKRIPNAGMAVINDIGNPDDIHPRNKATVGMRLARLALKRSYGREEVVDSGPVPTSITRLGKQLRIEFEQAQGGLRTRDGREPDNFEIAGNNGIFVPASTQLEGNSILLSADAVQDPISVRFAWNNTASPNLINEEGLPASAFRRSAQTGK